MYKKNKHKVETSKIIVVEWYDAVADGQWEEHAKAELHKCLTAGFLVDETKEAYCIASTISMDSSNARMSIPKVWVKKKRIVSIMPKKRSVSKRLPEEIKEPTEHGNGTTERTD